MLSVEGIKNTDLVDYLLEKYNLVIAPIFPEKNAVRISTHIWVTFKQIDVLLKGIKELLS